MRDLFKLKRVGLEQALELYGLQPGQALGVMMAGDEPQQAGMGLFERLHPPGRSMGGERPAAEAAPDPHPPAAFIRPDQIHLAAPDDCDALWKAPINSGPSAA